MVKEKEVVFAVDGERKKIILVDDKITNLTIGRRVLAEKYNVFTVPSGEKLFMLFSKVIPDMILLDVEMPEMNGYEVIKILKANPETAHIPVIFLTARNDADSELAGLSLGAVDYIYKPFSPALLLKRIELHLLLEEQKKELTNYSKNLEEMVRHKTRAVLELQNAVLQVVAGLVETRDNNTGGHIERTQSYLKILIGAMFAQNLYQEEISSWNTELLISSAQLHDVGKIAIKDSILQKPGPLSGDEFEEMKKHSVYGEEIIEKIGEKTKEEAFLKHAKVLAGCHHENWDGSGYPRGLKDRDIPLESRLMAIVDVYDALVSTRAYKPPLSHEEAVGIILKGRGTKFEPALVDLFLSVADKFDRAAKNIC